MQKNNFLIPDQKIIAFVKYSPAGNDRWAFFIIEKGTSLEKFINRLLNNHKANYAITLNNYKFTSFHVKSHKGGIGHTMKNNPIYYCSHSLRNGFFQKGLGH